MYNKEKLKHNLYQEIIDEYKKSNNNPFTLLIYIRSLRITKQKLKNLVPQKLKKVIKRKLKSKNNDGWCD